MWSLSVYMLSRVQLFVTPWTVAHQAPLSMGSPQARILDWIAISFSRGSSQPRDQTHITCLLHRQADPLPLRCLGSHVVLSPDLNKDTIFKIHQCYNK